MEGRKHYAILALLALPIAHVITRGSSAPDQSAFFKQYCYQCHANSQSMGGIKLDQILTTHDFSRWQKIIAALDDRRMPPKGMPQPSDTGRTQAAAWLRSELKSYVAQHEGEPGRVTVRRLTSGEYAYALHDLTGIDIDTGIDASTDSVGGEGFTNYGDVQFMQDAGLERYLTAAKRVASHAVIGAGPLSFFTDPGDTGFEFSAIARIKEIYENNGIRTVSGEGGLPYGLERYGKAFYVAWEHHRNPKSSLDQLAAREGITARFARHIWNVLHEESLSYPLSEVAARWRKTPSDNARAACDDLQKFVITWPLWLFARGDAAVGGAGDESPLIINDTSLKLQDKKHFAFIRGPRKGEPPQTSPARIYLNVSVVNPSAGDKASIVWRNASIAYRTDAEALRTVPGEKPKGARFGAKQPLEIQPGATSVEVPLPERVTTFQFQADAELGSNRDQVLRIVITDRPDGTSRGIPVRGLLADPNSEGYRKFKDGVMELARLMPPNTHSEPTPADKDPIPLPFDSAFNVPEHDEFDNRVKYVRDDKFIYNNILSDADRARVDQAWLDLYDSFPYHDNYLDLLAKHFEKNPNSEDLRRYAEPIRAEKDAVKAAQAAARPQRVADCLEFAARAWRRPLTPSEKSSLLAFYDRTMTAEKDHRKAVRALITRILVSPAFLYHDEQDVASRLSFFLWSSIPDAELRNAPPTQLRAQVKRMLADPKARRLATEFFGQWLGFYRFDQFRGVDTSRFPEFTDDVRNAMYDEAISFFEHIVRQDRPVREILTANYTYVNQPLAKFYALPAAKSGAMELLENAREFHRGGVLRLGAILTATSAPLRTSPVKRGDWVLRRLLGTAVPPPPADAGSLPPDEKQFGGLSLREKLEQHKRNATCAGCHVRIDPLGFPLEKFDSTGRYREKYADGKPIPDSVEELDRHLEEHSAEFRRTLATKLIGYALGRAVQPTDQPLIDRMAVGGSDTPFSRFVEEVVVSRQFRNVQKESPK